MKLRSISLLAWLLTAVTLGNCFAGGGGTVTAGTTSTLLLGSPYQQNLPVWLPTNAYAQASYTFLDGQMPYFCLVAGTSTNALANIVTVTTGSVDRVDNSVTWRRCLASRGRQGMVIVNASTNVIYLNDAKFFGNIGIQLQASGGSWSVSGKETPQNEVWVRSSNSNSPVMTYEW